MKKLLFTLIYLVPFITSFTQEPTKKSFFGKTFTIGGSYTLISDLYDDLQKRYLYFEHSVNINFAVQLSKRTYLGVQTKPTFTNLKVISDPWDFYRFNGIFFQFDLIQHPRFRFFIETSLNESDYCTCENGNYWNVPYKAKGLIFAGIGGGFDIILNNKKQKNLSLELGIFDYLLINSIPEKYPYLQYIVGLNYRFGKIMN